MPRYVIYTRVSKDHDGTSTSPAAQHDECARLAAAQGWGEVEHRSDVDTSAWSRAVVRPQYQRVLEDIRVGHVDGLVVHHLDRLLRQSRELEQLIDAIEARTRGTFPIYSVHGDLDLSTPDGRFQARILTSVAQKESDDKSRRLKLVLGKLAQEGKGHGGKVPYGWQADRVSVEPHEAAVVERAVGWVLDGVGLNECANRLNGAGVRTRQNAQWYPTTIRQILTNPRLAGLRTHHGRVVATGDWEPIIDIDTHRRLVDILSRPAHPNHHVNLTYWLTGIAQCGACGAKLRSRSEGGKAKRYVCRKDMGGCGLQIAAEQLHALVAAVVVGLIRDHGLGPRVEDVDVRTVEEELAAAQLRLEQLSRDHYSDGLITKGEFLAARDPLSQKVVRLQEQLDRHASAEQVSGVVEWDALNASERSLLAAEILEAVVIHRAVRGRRFDPSRVELLLRSDVGRV